MVQNVCMSAINDFRFTFNFKNQVTFQINAINNFAFAYKSVYLFLLLLLFVHMISSIETFAYSYEHWSTRTLYTEEVNMITKFTKRTLMTQRESMKIELLRASTVHANIQPNVTRAILSSIRRDKCITDSMLQLH